MTEPSRIPQIGDAPVLEPEDALTARVLVVDDSPLIHRLLGRQLAAQRMDVLSATTGSEGLAATRSHNPDAILLDAELPDASGFEILAALKAAPDTHDVPVILLSASSEIAEKVRAFEMGAIDYITKPFDIAEVKARLHSAVRMHHMMELLAQRAQIDGLTGLFNRSYLDHRLTQEVAEAERFGTRLSLVICDLDRFKSLNDAYGHPFGDRVLEAFAQILNSGRISDTACRYGGEEFAVVLPRASAAEASGVAERFRDALSRFRWDGHPELQVTASFGVADLDCIDPRTAPNLLCAADEALYAAKQAGRNRVVITAARPAAPRQTAHSATRQ